METQFKLGDMVYAISMTKEGSHYGKVIAIDARTALCSYEDEQEESFYNNDQYTQVTYTILTDSCKCFKADERHTFANAKALERHLESVEVAIKFNKEQEQSNL